MSESDYERLVVAGAVTRLRKIAEELESGKIRPMSFERFKSFNSPLFLENHIEVMGEDSVVASIGWMERIE